MKILPRLILLLFVAASPVASADELVKKVQTALKEEGFYYSEITGESGPDTVAAIKRYQIRNGLEVTGTLTAETMKALDLGGGPTTLETPKPLPQTTPPPRVVPPPPVPGQNTQPPSPGRTEPPVNLRKDDSVQERDRYFLKREETNRNVPGPADPNERGQPPFRGGGPAFAELYQRTPYANAPLEVQQDVLRKAQRALAGGGFYRSTVDGFPGPATEEAILGYQRLVRLPMTGRLDLETLSAMRLLPGRGSGPAMQPFTRRSEAPPPTKKVYRGIWID